MTYVDAVTLQSSNKPLQFSVTAAAYITLDLTDTNLDKDVVNLVGKVVSDEPDTLELPQTFIFTIEIYHRPCEKNLKTDMDFSKVQYVLGQPLLIVELDRFNNNNCDFSLILADKDIDPPVTTSLPGVTLIQATFQDAVQVPWMSPHYKEIVTFPRLEIVITDPAFIGEQRFKIWMLWEDQDNRRDFIVEVLPAIPVWRNLPINNQVYDVDYQIGTSPMTMTFDQDATQAVYTVEFYDTIAGQSLPSSVKTQYMVKAPVFTSGFAPPVSATDYQQLTVQSNDYTLDGLKQTVLVVLQDIAKTETKTFSFQVTYTLGGCSSNPYSRPNLSQTYTYYIGQPMIEITAAESNGDCPFQSQFTRSTELTPIAETYIYQTPSTLIAPVNPSLNYVRNAEAKLFIFTNNVADAQTILLTFRLWDEANQQETSVNLTIDIIIGSCTCGFQGLPASAQVFDHLIGSTAKTISLAGLTNTECAYSIQVQAPLGGTTLPTSTFTVVQPVMISQPVYHELTGLSCSITFVTQPSVSISTSDWTLEQTLFDVLLVTNSLSTPSDTATSSALLMQVTFVPPACVPLLTLPTMNAKYMYKIGDPALTITFTGANNGNCDNFVQTVTYSDLSPPDSLIFTLSSQPSLSNNFPSSSSTTFSVVQDGSMAVQTTDLYDEMLYSFVIVMVDVSGTIPDASVTFDVQIHDNLCIKAFRGIPVDNAFDQVYAIGQGTKEVLLSGLDNTECEFSIDLFSDAALLTPSDSTMFTAVDPVFSGLIVSSGAKVQMISTDSSLAGTSIDVFVRVNSDRNTIDNDETSFIFSVNFVLTTCSTSLISTASMSALWTTNYDYRITDPALSINFSGILNNDCQFTATLIDKNTLVAPPTWMALTQPTFTLTAQPDLYTVTISAVLTIQTNTVTDKGTLELRLSVTDEFTTSTSTFDFTVWTFNNPCSKGLNNVPLDNQFDTLYTLGSSAVDLNLLNLDNTECQYRVELFYDVGLAAPVDPSILSDDVAQALTVIQPSFTTSTGAIYPEILTVTATPIIRIQSTTWILQDLTVVAIHVKVISMQDSIDTDFTSFALNLDFMTMPCIPILQNQLTWPTFIQYKISSPALSMAATGLSNNDCAFVSTLTDQLGAAPHIAFQWNLSSFTTVFAPNVFSVNTPAFLTIQTTDYTQEGYYDLSVEQTDIWGSSPQYFDFQVRLYNNYCQPGFQGLPSTDSILEQEYTIRVINVTESYTLDLIKNTECSYSVEIYNTTEGQALSSSFTLIQPTFAIDPVLSDPELLMVTSSPVIYVNTNDPTYDGQTISVLVVLRSTRYAQDTYTEQFLMNVKMILGCDPLFADQILEPKPVITQTYLIGQDSIISIDVASSNLLFNPTCKSPYQTSFSLSNSDGSAVDQQIFSLTESWSSTNGPSGTISISAQNKEQAGLYSLRLIEKDTAESGIAEFETSLEFSLIDFCASAEIQVTEVSSEIYYVAESGPMIADLSAAQSNFLIDSEHKSACSPVKFLYDKRGGAEFNPSWVQIDSLSGSVSIDIGSLQNPTEFVIQVSGQVKGDGDYSKAEHQVKVIVTIPEKVDEPEEIVQSEKNDTQAFDNVIMLQEQRQKKKEQLLETAYNWFADLQENKNVKADQPLLDIFEVTKAGLMTISFSKPMIVPSWSLLVLGDYPSEKERIQALEIEDYLTLHVESDQYTSEDSEIAIDKFTLIDYTQSQMQLQVDFTSPNDISKDAGNLDQIFVTVKNNVFFIDKDDLLLIPLELVTSEDLPGQLTLAQELERVELEEQLDSTMQAVSWANLAVNLVFAYGIKYLWNAINLLQMAVYFPLWKLNYSQNAISFLKFFKMIVLMEFLPTHLITEPLTELFGIAIKDEDLEVVECQESNDCEEQDNSSESLRRLLEDEIAKSERHSDELEESMQGYSKKKKPNIIQAIGIIIFLAVILTAALALAMMMRCCIYSDYRCFRLYMNIKQKVFYNAFIRFAIQSSLKLQIGACLTLSLIDWQETSQIGQGAFALILIFSFVAIPIFFIVVLVKNRENLSTLSMKNTIGTMYAGIDTENTFALSYSIVFLVRRSLFCFFTFAMFEIPGIQTHVFIFSSVMYTVYLNSTTFYETKLMQFQENLNETIFILICYHLVLFGNLVDDYDTLTMIGTSLASSCAFMLAINLLIIMVVNAGQSRQKCRRSFLKKRQQKAIEKRRKALLEKQIEIDQQPEYVKVIEARLKSGQVPAEFDQQQINNGSLSDSSLQLRSISASSFNDSIQSRSEVYRTPNNQRQVSHPQIQIPSLTFPTISIVDETTPKPLRLPRKKRDLSRVDTTVLQQTQALLQIPNYERMLQDSQIVQPTTQMSHYGRFGPTEQYLTPNVRKERSTFVPSCYNMNGRDMSRSHQIRTEEKNRLGFLDC